MILDPLASHPISAFRASFLNKRTTPYEWGASSSSCPESTINSPVVNRGCPDWVHRASQSDVKSPICCCNLSSFPASYLIRTFQVSMFKVVLVERRVIEIVASFRFPPHHVILPGKPGPASSMTEVLLSFVVRVSVALFSLRDGSADSTLDPPPFSDSLGTVRGGVYDDDTCSITQQANFQIKYALEYVALQSVGAYAPNSAFSEGCTENRLDSEIRSTPNGDILVMVEDWNATIEHDAYPGWRGYGETWWLEGGECLSSHSATSGPYWIR